MVIDMIVNGYSLSKDYVPQRVETGEVINAADLPKKIASPSEKPMKVAIPTDAKPAAPVKSAESEETISLYGFVDKETITVDLLTGVGVKDGKIKAVNTDKPFLQAISLPENAKNRLKVVNLFDFEEYLGTIYALNFLNTKEAGQFYSDLKAESLKISGIEIRETNTFGDASFYLNQEGKTKTAFVTVRIGADIYGFEYPHGSHQMFKDLAEKLQSTSSK